MNAVAVKIGYEDNLHRLRIDLNTFSLASLTQLFKSTFPLLPQDFVITYTDADGDRLNVCSDAEFMEACRVFLSGNNDELKAMKFTAVARGGVAVSASPADTLINAVERLVVTLNDAVEKAKEGEWKGMEGISDTLTLAAQDAANTLETTRQAVQEKPFEHVLDETSEGLKSAAVGISSFAQRFVKSFIPEKKTESDAALEETESDKTPAVGDAVEPDDVAIQTIETPTNVQEATPPSVAFSDVEIRWAEELSMIRSIFPEIETARVVDMLERSQGDVNVVLNALMEHI